MGGGVGAATEGLWAVCLIHVEHPQHRPQVGVQVGICVWAPSSMSHVLIRKLAPHFMLC